MRGPCFTVSGDRIMAKRDSVTRFSVLLKSNFLFSAPFEQDKAVSQTFSFSRTYSITKFKIHVSALPC